MMERETKAQMVGRNDALDWLSESEPREWLVAVHPEQPAADEELINAVGYEKAGRLLGVRVQLERELSSEARTAFGEYAAAYRAELEQAIANARKDGRL